MPPAPANWPATASFNHLAACPHDGLLRLSVTPVTHWVLMPPSHRPPEALLATLVASRGRSERLTHTEHLPARRARHAPWPDTIRPEIRAAALELGIEQPWAHQAEAMNLAKTGQTVVIATGTASGKSLGYLAPVLSDLLDGTEAPNGRGATALYLAPTKALAADQRRRATELAPTPGCERRSTTATPRLRSASGSASTPRTC